MGLVTAAEELAMDCNKADEVAENVAVHFNRSLAMIEAVDTAFKKIVGKCGGEREVDGKTNRNEVEVRAQIVQSFLKAHLYKR